MKAIVFERFGADVLSIAAVGEPEPGPGQVRIAIRNVAAPDVGIRIRSDALQQLSPTSPPAVPGQEGAGDMESVGEGVIELEVGDEAMGFFETGAYAELVLARDVVHKRLRDRTNSGMVSRFRRLACRNERRPPISRHSPSWAARSSATAGQPSWIWSLTTTPNEILSKASGLVERVRAATALI